MLKIKEEIISFAKSLGFDLIGFSKAELNQENYKKYLLWLNRNFEGDMLYMRKKTFRRSPENILKNARCVISLGINYYHQQSKPKKDEGIIARYAYGRDYHKIIGKKLKQLEKFIHQIAEKKEPEILTKSYVDTGPFFDRAFAVQCGLGEIGKNSCLITKEFGSWIFISEIITTLEIPGDFPEKNSKPPFSVCGTCTKCIDSCPTKAIIAPGVIDARRCISYLTIENKNKIPKEFYDPIKKTKRLFGCDICQEVCPHNCRAKEIASEELKNPKIAGNTQNLKKILSLKTDEEFLETFAGSPLMRAKLKGLKRNATIMQ